MNISKHLFQTGFYFLLTASLAACGGGGSDSGGDNRSTSSTVAVASSVASLNNSVSSVATSTSSTNTDSVASSSVSSQSSNSNNESSASSSVIVVINSSSSASSVSSMINSSKNSSSRKSSTSSANSNSSNSSSASPGECGSTWYKANLTHYESYPEPGSDECVKFNGCTWAGQFYGLPDKMPEAWVQANNIAAIHLKDWDWLGLKTINLRQGTKRITAKVYDGCADSDCSGCCTQNLGGDGYLVDLEKYTMQRFGSGSGIVEFQICE